jgi:hypothetical protein
MQRSITISADLSLHLLEVCPVALKKMSLCIHDAFWSASARTQGVFSAFYDRQHRPFSVRAYPKTHIENT